MYLYNQLNQAQGQIDIVEEQKTDLIKEVDGLTKNLKDSENWLAQLKHPDMQPYLMTGNTLSPDLKLVSFVNDKDKSVVITTSNLPELDDAHDYQMWADVEGEMINMGVIDTSKELTAMTYIDHAESLNITIEPLGGNDHPTVSNLVTSVSLR